MERVDSRCSVFHKCISDCQVLAEPLKNKYGLLVTLAKPEVTKAGIQQYRLCVSAKSYEILRHLIYPELIPSMVYKFPD